MATNEHRVAQWVDSQTNAIIPASVMACPELSCRQKLVYGLLCWHESHRPARQALGESEPEPSTLAEAVALSDEEFCDVCAELADTGLVVFLPGAIRFALPMSDDEEE